MDPQRHTPMRRGDCPESPIDRELHCRECALPSRNTAARSCPCQPSDELARAYRQACTSAAIHLARNLAPPARPSFPVVASRRAKITAGPLFFGGGILFFGRIRFA